MQILHERFVLVPIKQAIRSLPGFSGASGNHFSQKQSIRKPDHEFDLPNMGVDPSLSREDLDRLF